MLYINNVYCEEDSMIFAHGDQNLYMYIVFTGNIRFALCLVSDPLLVLSQLLRQIQSPITKTCSTTINTASLTNEIFFLSTWYLLTIWTKASLLSPLTVYLYMS